MYYPKICFIVIENESKLVKAFKHFSFLKDNEVQVSETTTTTSDNDDVISTGEANNGDDDEDCDLEYHVFG